MSFFSSKPIREFSLQMSIILNPTSSQAAKPPKPRRPSRSSEPKLATYSQPNYLIPKRSGLSADKTKDLTFSPSAWNSAKAFD